MIKRYIAITAFVVMAFCLSTQAQVKRKTKAVVKPLYSMASSIAAGQVIYKKNCLTCHQADGGGVQRMNPPLNNTTYVLGDKVRLINIILNGFKDEVEINGQYYSNIMPSHDFLKDQEIADVLTFVRNSFGNKASAVTIAQVKQVRATNKK